MPVSSISGFQAVSQSCLTLINNLNPFTSRFSLNWRDSDAIAGAVSIVNRAVGALFDKSYIACGAFVALGALSLYNGYYVYYFGDTRSLKNEIKLLTEKNKQLENDNNINRSKIDELQKQNDELQETKRRQNEKISSLEKVKMALKDALEEDLDLASRQNSKLRLQSIELKQGDQSQQYGIQPEGVSLDESCKLGQKSLESQALNREMEAQVKKSQQENQDLRQKFQLEKTSLEESLELRKIELKTLCFKNKKLEQLQDKLQKIENGEVQGMEVLVELTQDLLISQAGESVEAN